MTLMPAFLKNPSQRFSAALVASFLVNTLFLRLLWSYSLGNGDELFFSTGGGRFNVSDGTVTQWAELLSYIWWEHNGRTIDWLSAAVYFFGEDAGRWIASVITTLSAAIIVWCIHRLVTFSHPEKRIPVLIAPIAISSILFSYSTLSLAPLANLTMYSASSVNYLVPSCMLMLAVTLVTTGHKLSSLYLGAVIALLTATMHEQSAVMVAALMLVLLFAGSKRWKLQHRLAASLIAVFGVAEIFLSPGLHNKLDRAAALVSQEAVSLPRKVVTTFYAFGMYFPLLGLTVSAVIFFYLIRFSISDRYRTLSISLLTTLTLSTALWILETALLLVSSPLGSQTLAGLSCITMMTSWILTPLLASSPAIRFGSLFFLSAAASLAIPAATGLGAVRVFNYSIIFFITFLLWSTMIGSDELPHMGESSSSYRADSSASIVLLTALALMSAWVMTRAWTAFEANYDPGLESLIHQATQCNKSVCPAIDPQLPYPDALSGYGDHDYASTEAVLEWLEK